MSNGRFRKGGPPGPADPDHPDQPYHPPAAYYGLVTRAHDDLLRRAALLATERAEAPARVRELLGHPPARRRILIAEHPRFQAYAVAEHLLRTCRATWSDDPAQAEDLAQLALALTDALGADALEVPAPVLHALRAQAWSYIANCRRIRSDLRAVPEAFRQAHHHLALGTGDPDDEVAVLDLEASYLIDQRRFEEAETTLERVIGVYRKAGERHMEGRAMINLARLRHEQGRTVEAIPLLEQAAERIDRSREPHLELVVERSRVLWLAESDRAEEALALLPDVRRLARKAPRLERLRLLWTGGIVYHHLGHHALAAEAIAQARDGFVAEGVGYDAALATLDLALVHLDAGDPERACALAADLPPLFAARDIDREAAAALAVVHRAMQQQALTREIVRQAAAHLQRNRRL